MLTEAILLDISQAERQIRELERELDRLNEPVRVPVDIQGEQAADELRRDFSNADVAVADLNSELRETDRELDQIRNSADRAGREIDETGRRGVTSFNGMAVAAGAFGVALAAAVGVRAFIGFAGRAIDAASDFEESLSKSQVVFGAFSDDIEAFARTGPQALGLANREALAFTATFGNLFVALGLSQQEAAELSPAIVQLGADLASFNNIDVSDALEKLRSGLVGEAEPLRALGVNINETVVSAKALELGLGGVTGELTEAEKVQARYALILEQTVTAQGDYARTADGLANTQRTLNAQWEDARAALGEALVPAFQALLDIAPAVITAIEDLTPVVANLAQSFADGAPAVDQFADVVQVIGALGDALGLLKEFTDAPRDLALGLGALFTGNIVGGFNQIREGFDSIVTGVDNANVAIIRNDLVNALQAGVDPALALADALETLTSAGLDTSQLEEASAALLSISGLKGTNLLQFRSQLRGMGLEAGQVEVLSDALSQLITETGALDILDPKLDNFTRKAEAVGDAAIPISETATEILNLAQAGESLEDFAPDLGAQGFVDGLDAMTTAMSGAQEALRDSEGEIVDDLDTFLSNLDEVFANQLDFARNISVLRSRGLDQLADVFEEAGLEAAGALADAVSDPAAANEANAKIAAQGSELAQAQFAAFDTEIKQLIAGYEPDAVVIPLTFGGLPDIPISAITAGGIVPIPGRAGATEITTNIIVDSNEELPSAASRAVQIINSGVNASRSGPS